MEIKVNMKVQLNSPSSPTGFMLFDTDFVQPIEWSDSYLVGVPLIDTQHKRLFQLIEELRIAYFRKKSGEIVLKTLNGLLAYCAEHFESEELLMRAVGYPIVDSHAGIHQRFTKTAYGWLVELKQGTLDVKTVLRTLMNWLVDHVLMNDTKIGEFCRNQNFVMSRLTGVSDLVEILQEKRRWWHNESLFDRIVLLCIVPPLLLLFWLAFWNPPSYIHRVVAACITIVFAICCNVLLVMFIKSCQSEQGRRSRVSHAKQLAENLVAGEIAARIAVMDVDNMDEFFSDTDGYLLQTMKEILGHIRSYLPYIPSTLLALVRGEGEEEEEEEDNHDAASNEDGSAAVPVFTGRSVDSDTFVKSSRSAKSSRQPTTDSNRLSIDSKTHATLSVEDLTSDETHRSSSRTISTKRNVSISGENFGASTVKTSRKSARAGAGAGAETGRRTSRAKIDMLDRWIQKKSVTVMATSISDFDGIMKMGSPQDVLEIHSKYIGLLEQVCKTTKAVFGTMTGDRVLLSWNSANSVGSHAEQACNAALKIRDGFRELFQHSYKPSIGISSAPMSIGNMGSKTKLGFSILGPIPPFVEALCELNKQFRTEILVSSQTWRDVKDMFIGKVISPIDVAKPEAYVPPSSPERSCSSSRTANSSTAVQFLSPTATVPAESLTSSALTRMLAVELKGAAKREVDEWMYAIQDAERNDPFAKYNEMVYKLFYGDVEFALAKTQLQEYVKSHVDDIQAFQVLTLAEQHDVNSMSSLSWKTGWVLR